METTIATPLISTPPALTDHLHSCVTEASRIISAYWPISTFIANNPLSGLEDLPFDEAVDFAQAVRGTEGYLPLWRYRQLYEQARINDTDLETAASDWLTCQKLPQTVLFDGQLLNLPPLYRRWLLQPDTRLIASQPTNDWAKTATRLKSLNLVSTDTPRLETAGDKTTVRGGQSVTEVVNGRMISLCAAFLDEGQAAWTMPGRERGFYACWQSLVGHDKSLRRYTGPDLPTEVARLSSDPAQTLIQLLDRLAIPPTEWATYLTRHLAQLPGWAGLIRWRQEHPETPRQQQYPITLLEYLAVRLFYEVVLVEARSSVARPSIEVTADSDELVARLTGWAITLGLPLSALSGLPDDDFMTLTTLAWQCNSIHQQSIWQAAYENHYRRHLLADLASQSARPLLATAPAAQAIFCIDVRSEGLRRNLERQGAYETFGFAGFFGLPMLYRPLGSACDVTIGPALLKPTQPVREVPVEADAESVERYLSNNQRRYRWGTLLHSLRENLLTPFAFVEMVGWLSVGSLLGKTLLPDHWHATRRRLQTRLNPPVPTRPSIINNEAEMPLANQAQAVAGMLKSIGLTQGFARLVMICGHGSETENNPYASALDCGACGGNQGGTSSLVAASILNTPSVRDLLAEQGIVIPAQTFFLAAEHNTTTDRVEFLNTDGLPASHQAEFAELTRSLAVAGDRAGQERWANLPAPKSRQFEPDRLIHRASDWAQTRPEWGLVRNAAFICGRRALTSGLNLENRVFLHSYDPAQDPQGAILEGIMTAPVVVAEWINMQYYLSSVDNDRLGSGTKLLHSVVGQVGVMQGRQSDLLVGLPRQSVMVGDQLYHEPLRLCVIIEAPTERISPIIARHSVLSQLTTNEWISLVAYDSAANTFFRYSPNGEWLVETGPK